MRVETEADTRDLTWHWSVNLLSLIDLGMIIRPVKYLEEMKVLVAIRLMSCSSPLVPDDGVIGCMDHCLVVNIWEFTIYEFKLKKSQQC